MAESMVASDSFPIVARFDQFQVDFSSGVLQRSGVRVPVQSQPLQVLRLLLEAEGRVVTREELRKVLWPEDTFVDFELGVNTAVKKLRQALADPADHPKFIETLPRIGHRFRVPVEWVTDDSQKGTLAKSTNSVMAGGMVNSSAPERTPMGLSSVGYLRWMAIGSAILVALLGIAVWRIVRTQTKLPIEVVPLVGLPGMENDPAFSPDGNQVAFAIRNPANSGIYTTVVGGEKSLRLTTHPGDGDPRWSPDGRQLAFTRSSQNGVAIYVIPALGGTEHRLYSSPAGINHRSLDWSPDGKVLAITEIDADRIHTWIAFLSLADSTTQRLTSPSDQEEDCDPAFSPDGGTVAFVRGSTTGVVADIYVVPSSGGEPRRLTHDNTWIFGSPAWTADGRDIVFSSMRAGLASLWRVSASGGTPRPLVGVGLNAASPSISRKENQLVYQQTDFKNNIWRLDLSDEKTRRGPPSIVISDKGPSLARPHFSPDGNRIAFESDRLGYADLWTCNSDGSNCGQLTSLHGTAGAVAWSPDGRQFAFEFRPKQHSEVYLAEVEGGPPRLLQTFPGSDNGGPNWSRDGKWIYFYSNHGGSLQIWKIQLNGGPPVQVTTKGGVVGAESSDGGFLYFARLDAPGLWKMPLHGGQETRIFDQPFVPFSWWDWGLTDKGIYFIDFQAGPHATLAFFEFATNKIFPIWAFTNRPFVGLSVSVDGKSILYAQNEYSQSDIVLVKNFR
jgi:Tol biopolymer transport system component/DNA-binding winged helix-turn-helix (wHTH) protein